MTNRFFRRVLLWTVAVCAAQTVCGAPPARPANGFPPALRKNMALVVDVSATAPDAFARRKAEAAQAVARLDGDDFVSLVVFSDRPAVLVPARPANDKAPLLDALGKLEAKGGQALFAGLSKGADEVRRNLKLGFENRIVLFSDGGTGTVGPSGREVVARLVASLEKEGIGVRTGDDRPLGNTPGVRRPGLGPVGRGPGPNGPGPNGLGPNRQGPNGLGPNRQGPNGPGPNRPGRGRGGFGNGRNPRGAQP